MECLNGQALIQDPKAEVVYADISLNSVLNGPFNKEDWQSPKLITESLLQAQQRLEQSGVTMLTMIGHHPARGDNPETFLKDALQEKGVRFLGEKGRQKLRNIFQRMGFMF